MSVHRMKECIVLKDYDDIERLIPPESLFDADFKLFGMTLDEIRKMRAFAIDRGYIQ